MITWRLKLAAFLFYSAFCSALGAWVVDNKWQSDWDSHMLADAQASEKAATEALNQQRELLAELEKVQNNAKAMQDKLETDRLAAADSANRLRAELDRIKASAKANNPSTISERANAATDRIVLANVLERADAAAGILADYADVNRKAVINCNAEYNAIRKSINGR